MKQKVFKHMKIVSCINSNKKLKGGKRNSAFQTNYNHHPITIIDFNN